MIPILYEASETVFTNNGLGRLVDCIECKVTEERNGVFECEFVYPMNGEKFSDILEGRIISVTHDESGDPQPFDIYGHSAPIDGKVTFYAHHISYRQAGITVEPFTATTCATALAGLKTNAINTNSFDYWTDKAVTADFEINIPKPVNSLLKGEEGSILSVYGSGEYEFDKFDVKLHVNRGSDNGVTIRYGKNLIDLTDELDYTDSHNGIVPYWVGSDENGDEIVVTLSEWVLYKSGVTYDGRNTVIPFDFSSAFEAQPTEAELRTKAQTYLADNDPRLPVNTLTVDFVQLWQTEEYKDYAPLQTVSLCDTVHVIFEKLNMNVALKVVKTVWNPLLDRYDEIQLGDTPLTYAQVITEKLAAQSNLAYKLARWSQGWSTNALSIAGDTNQHFWFTGTGNDTGAHITEETQENFLVDPSNGGPNLLARSTGVAVRDGLTELATFGSNGISFSTTTPQTYGGGEGLISYDPTEDTLTFSGEGVMVSSEKSLADTITDIEDNTTSINTLDETISLINKSLVIDSTEPSITLQASDTANESTLKITEQRLSFQKNGVEVAYIDSAEAEGVIDINNARIHDSIRIGELELFSFDGGIGIRRTS